MAKPRTRKAAATRRHPGAIRRPTVQASVPQARAATTAWVVTSAVAPPPTAFSARGRSGGRAPTHSARDHNDRWAIAV